MTNNDPSRELAVAAADLAADGKALDISILELREISSVADYFVVASGRSHIQVEAICDRIVEGVRDRLEERPLAVEGLENSQWAVLDYGSVVVHVFQEGVRKLYDLERLWSLAPSWKHGEKPPARPAAGKRPPAVGPAAAPGGSPAAGKKTAAKPAAKPAARKSKTGTRTAATPAGKAAAKAGAKTGLEPGSQQATKPATKPAAKTAPKPAGKAAAKKTDSKPAKAPARKNATGARSRAAAASGSSEVAGTTGPSSVAGTTDPPRRIARA